MFQERATEFADGRGRPTERATRQREWVVMRKGFYSPGLTRPRVSDPAKAGRIPREIIEFFHGVGGHSLIVKGPAGTGKTTFALQLTEELGQVAASHYLSTRVSDASLYNQFAWLRERLKPHEAPAAKKDAKSVAQLSRKALNILTGKLERGELAEDDEGAERPGADVREGFLDVELGQDLPEVEMAYDFVEKSLPGRSLILIDSIDALAERYGIAAPRLINTIQQDLVESSGANVLYVLEGSGETRLDYLGDGVVSFVSSDHHGRRLRVMTIEKLRGQEVRQHRYLYTLDGGRLMAFDIAEKPKIAKAQPWKAHADLSKDAVSTGIPPLDALVGGLARGRVTAFEITNSVPSEYIDWLRLAMICNAAAQGRGVAHVPPRKGTTDFLRELVSPHLAAGAFEANVRVFEPASLGHAEQSTNALPLEGSNVDADLKWSNVEYRLPQASRPFLAFMAFDTLESMYGEKVIEEMSGVLASVRRARDTFVGFATPGSASAPKLANLASVLLHVESVNGSVVLYGDKPYTGVYNLSFDWSTGRPEAQLRPIV
jgi:KaiC/GvpD/RAD55 family RecA-like ATPase